MNVKTTLAATIFALTLTHASNRAGECGRRGRPRRVRSSISRRARARWYSRASIAAFAATGLR